jgi:hypothetical protein
MANQRRVVFELQMGDVVPYREHIWSLAGHRHYSDLRIGVHFHLLALSAAGVLYQRVPQEVTSTFEDSDESGVSPIRKKLTQNDIHSSGHEGLFLTQ